MRYPVEVPVHFFVFLSHLVMQRTHTSTHVHIKRYQSQARRNGKSANTSIICGALLERNECAHWMLGVCWKKNTLVYGERANSEVALRAQCITMIGLLLLRIHSLRENQRTETLSSTFPFKRKRPYAAPDSLLKTDLLIGVYPVTH